MGIPLLKTVFGAMTRRKSILPGAQSRRRWLVRRQGLKKEKEAGLRRIPLQPAALTYYRCFFFQKSKKIFIFFITMFTIHHAPEKSFLRLALGGSLYTGDIPGRPSRPGDPEICFGQGRTALFRLRRAGHHGRGFLRHRLCLGFPAENPVAVKLSMADRCRCALYLFHVAVVAGARGGRALPGVRLIGIFLIPRFKPYHPRQ